MPTVVPVEPPGVRARPAVVPAGGGAAMTVLSMACVQVSDALAVPLIGPLGPLGATSLRLTLGAVLLLVVVRPRVRGVTRAQWAAVAPLGVALAVLGAACMAAFETLPLGQTAAIAFLGPLALALARAGRRGAVWPLVALAGVLALTEPWRGASASASGIALALVAAGAWAATIVLTARVGARMPGLDGIALAMPVAALCVAPWGVPQAAPGITPDVVALGVGLAVLMPVLPCVLELLALRRLAQPAFATLMALEPALATVAGGVVLGQAPAPLPALGVLLVVAAGVGATRAGQK